MTTPTRATPRPDAYPCGECGMMSTASEFHPYWYCVLWKGGLDPRTYPDIVALRALTARLAEAERLLGEMARGDYGQLDSRLFRAVNHVLALNSEGRILDAFLASAPAAAEAHFELVNAITGLVDRAHKHPGSLESCSSCRTEYQRGRKAHARTVAP